MTSEVKNRSKAKQPASKGFKPAVFINYSLTEPDRARFAEWRETFVGRLWDAIDDLTGRGYTLSIKPDPYNECIAAYLQTSREEDENYGAILSGRSRSTEMAVLGVLFRHYALFEEQWPIETVRRTGVYDD